MFKSSRLVNCHHQGLKKFINCRKLCSLRGEPSQPIPGRKPKYVGAKEALSVLQSGNYFWSNLSTINLNTHTI